MKIRNFLVWIFLVVAAVILSLFLEEIISDGLIKPLTKILWSITKFYLSINQAILWGLVLIGVAVIAGFSLYTWRYQSPRLRHRRMKYHGEVGQLAFWIRGAKRTYLARWQIARTLAELAIKMQLDGGANAEQAKQLQGPGWKPPEKIQSYLLLALHTTAVTYRTNKKGKFNNPDPEILSIIEYIESFTENSNDY